MTDRRRVLDQALCDRAELLARSHPLSTVAAIVGILPSQLTAMRRRGWQAATLGRPARPRPTDFAIQSARLTWAELLLHYRCGPRALRRWLAETPGQRPSWQGDALHRTPRNPERTSIR